MSISLRRRKERFECPGVDRSIDCERIDCYVFEHDIVSDPSNAVWPVEAFDVSVRFEDHCHRRGFGGSLVRPRTRAQGRQWFLTHWAMGLLPLELRRHSPHGIDKQLKDLPPGINCPKKMLSSNGG
jgi:hypothetical protein